MSAATSIWDGAVLAPSRLGKWRFTATDGTSLEYVRGRTDGDIATETLRFAQGAVMVEFFVEEGGNPKVIDPETVDFYFHGALKVTHVDSAMIVTGVKAMVEAVSEGRRTYSRARIRVHP